MGCKHLIKPDEAYAISVGGREAPVDVHLCDWPDQNPDRFVDAPRWLMKQIGPGLMVVPERDCVRCPAYAAH